MKKNKQIETNKYILLDGTSSAGKSTIGKYFKSNNFFITNLINIGMIKE